MYKTLFYFIIQYYNYFSYILLKGIRHGNCLNITNDTQSRFLTRLRFKKKSDSSDVNICNICEPSDATNPVMVNLHN